MFRYDYPKTDITTEITVYPSLSDWGRLRSELDISASREIVKDFTVVLSFYDSYDSDSPDPTADQERLRPRDEPRLDVLVRVL